MVIFMCFMYLTQFSAQYKENKVDECENCISVGVCDVVGAVRGAELMQTLVKCASSH